MPNYQIDKAQHTYVLLLVMNIVNQYAKEWIAASSVNGMFSLYFVKLRNAWIKIKNLNKNFRVS